jgi:uncharacterized protein (DUF2141 family)
MKCNFITRAALFLALLIPATSWAELPSITVKVINLPTTTGTVEVSLFDSADSFMVEPYLQQSGTVNEDGTFETRFLALPEGEYAVVVVHDANDNQQLDTGFLGLTGEAFGYSNNVHPLFGRPSFDDVKVPFGQEDLVLEIDLD